MKLISGLLITSLLIGSNAYGQEESSPISITLEQSDTSSPRNSVTLSKNQQPEAISQVEQNLDQPATEISVAAQTENLPKPTQTAQLANESESSDTGSTMLVLDMSGSMWGQIGGRTKVEIAREVVGSALGDWDNSSKLGLMAYGHNHEGDCSDIEVLIDPAVLNSDEFIKSVNNLQPKGKTPMSAAVQQAAKALRHSEERATVILVSDGKETCSLDPCAIGNTLEATGFDFTAHIIGFDVPEEDTSGLRCLAETTGGVFLAAENADTLKQALNQAASLTTEANTRPELLLDPAIVDAPDQVMAGSQFLVKWSGPKNLNDRLHTLSPDLETQVNVKSIDTEAAGFPEVEMTAPEAVGDYTIEYRTQQGHVLGQDRYSVIAAEASIELPANVQTGAQFEVSWSGPQNSGDEIIFLAEDGSRAGSDIQVNSFAEESRRTYRAPLEAGIYLAQYVSDKGTVLAEETYAVSLASITIDAPDQVVAGSKFEVNWSGPQNTNDRLRVTDLDNPNKNHHSISINNIERDSSPSELRAPETPGTYSVHYWVLYSKTSLAADTFEVLPAQASIMVPSVVAAGKEFSVEWAGPENQLDDIRIVSVDDRKLNGRQSVGDSGRLKSPFIIRAPREAGDYLVIYQTRAKNILASQPLRVQ